MKLNLGCSTQIPDGWINVDYALGARLMKVPGFRIINNQLRLFNLEWDKRIYIHDLTTTFPWKSNTVDIVYSSHTLEHFTREEGRHFLSECHRVLRKNGIIRIVVPDLKHITQEYFDGSIRADDFLERLGVLFGNNKNRFKKSLLPFIQFPHKCMYDLPALLTIMDSTGFRSSMKTAFDSDIDDIKHVEIEMRTKHAVIVEGRKR